MAIRTLPNHTLDTFDREVTALWDCIKRSIDYATHERWEDRDLEYVIRQLDHARGFLLGARTAAMAQMACRPGHRELHPEVRVDL